MQTPTNNFTEAHCYGWLEVEGIRGLVGDIPRLYWNCHYSARVGFFGPLCPACFGVLPESERNALPSKFDRRRERRIIACSK